MDLEKQYGNMLNFNTYQTSTGMFQGDQRILQGLTKLTLPPKTTEAYSQLHWSRGVGCRDTKGNTGC